MGERSGIQLNLLEPLELQTRAPVGNKTLVPYGIVNEDSDYRIHVAYKIQHVYVFPTRAGKAALSENKYAQKSVKTEDITTALGYPVPVSSIKDIQAILIPHAIYQKHPISKSDSTTTKGAHAVEIVMKMLKRGLIPLPVHVDIADEKSIQIKGTDIIINSELKIQVKCDYDGGDRAKGGTGNLFLQIAECNPKKLF